MKTHTKAAFQVLCTAYPRWSESFTPAMVEIWGTLVEEIPADALSAAVKRLVKVNKFAPSVAEIFDAAGVKVAPAEGESPAIDPAKLARLNAICDAQDAKDRAALLASHERQA